jgi:hypothetical protein
MYIEDIDHSGEECIYNGEIHNHRVKLLRDVGYLKIDIGFDRRIDTFIELNTNYFRIPDIIQKAIFGYIGEDNQTYRWYHMTHKKHDGCEDELFWLSFVPGLVLTTEYPIIQLPNLSLIREFHPDDDRELVMSNTVRNINNLRRIKACEFPDKTMEIYTVDTCLDIASRIIYRIESVNRIIHNRQKVKFLDNIRDYTYEYKHHRYKGEYYQGH